MEEDSVVISDRTMKLSNEEVIGKCVLKEL